MDEFWNALCGGLFGAGALAAFVVWYIKKEIGAADARRATDLEVRRKRFNADNEWQHAVGRTIFWISHGVAEYETAEGKKYWNGDLKSAYDEMQKAEAECRRIDNEQLAAVNERK